MSIDNDDNLGVAQTIGQLRLQVEERETRSDRVKRSELDAANADLLAFGLKLAAKDKEIESLNATIHALRMSAKTAREPPAPRKPVTSSAEVALREENVALESQLRAAHVQSDEYKRRIARLEAATKAIPSLDGGELGRVKEQAAEYKRHIERMEADARGDGMQIAELRRKLDQAVMLAGKRQQEIDELLKQPAKVVEVASQSECQTCAPIIRAIAQAVTASNEPQAVPMPLPCERPSEMLPSIPKFITSRPAPIRHRILDALKAAAEPLTAAQLGKLIDLPAQTVQSNLYHVIKSREVNRSAPSLGQGDADQRGYRYWLASRPWPQEARA